MSDTFEIKIDDRDVQAAFNALIETASDLEPIFGDIGEYLLNEHEQRWENSVDSQGNLWEGLFLETWAKKEKKGKQFMLVDELQMLNSGTYQASSDSLKMGLSDFKAPFHHYGTKNGLPARELIGINAQDEDEILNIIADHIKNSIA